MLQLNYMSECIPNMYVLLAKNVYLKERKKISSNYYYDFHFY